VSQNYPQGHSIIRRTRFHRVKIGALKASFVELEEDHGSQSTKSVKGVFYFHVVVFWGKPHMALFILSAECKHRDLSIS